VLALVGSTTLAFQPENEPRTEIIRTGEGPVVGFIKNGMRQFLGIPYAAPPIGNLRWQPPQQPASWTTPFEAFAFGKTCAQSVTLHGFAAPSENEDCLFLNVFGPVRQTRSLKRPVMVWIHGGGLFNGASNDYDPTKLVQEGDVIFVSMNYRLNVFGFLAHPALDKEGHEAGNYGIMDQQLALKWVQQNIEAFGGDSKNVTIFGESAGGISVWAHLASPRSAGLFQRAIVESSNSGSANTATLESREALGQDFARAIGCSVQTVACLRSVSVPTILAANIPDNTARGGKFSFDPQTSPVADGIILPRPLRTAFSTGEFNHVPIMNGTNRDEYTWFQALAELNSGRIVTASEYATSVAAAFGANAPAVLNRYPLSNYQTPSNALAAAIGDRIMICGSRRATRSVSRFVDTYAYEFNVRDTPIATPLVSFPYFAAHTGEIPYLFPGFHGATGPLHELNKAQMRLATQIVQYWTTFARTGTPNSKKLKSPSWPRYEDRLDNYQRLELPVPVTFRGITEEHQCEFWDNIDR
jgi:para-nitrobenzyl esterase